MHFLRLLLASFLSRKLLMTLLFGWLIYRVHWANVQCLFSMTDPAQIQAFTTLTLTTMGTLGSIALGFLGFNTLSQMRTGSPMGNFLSRPVQPPSAPHEVGASTKNED